MKSLLRSLKLLKMYISTLLVLQKINNYTKKQKSKTTYANRWKVEWFISIMFCYLMLSGLPNVIATILGVFLKPLWILGSQNLQINLNFMCIHTFLCQYLENMARAESQKTTESKPIY